MSPLHNNIPGQAASPEKSQQAGYVTADSEFQQACEEQNAILGTEMHPNLWRFAVLPQGTSNVFQWENTLEMLRLPSSDCFLQLHQLEGVLR